MVTTCSHVVGMAIERHQAQESMELLQTCITKQNDIVIITEAEPIDEPGPRVIYVNDAFERKTGYSPKDIIGKTPRILHGAATDRNELDRINRSLKRWQPIRTELINYKKNGEMFWHELEIVPVSNADGWYTHWIGIGRDITERKKSEEEIRYLAYYDALTGLPNRRLLIDRLSQALIANARNSIYGALLFLDLDHFKNLNDTAGHMVGDLLLEQVAKRLQAEVREEDTVARMGGDEFVVMLKSLGDDVVQVAGQVQKVAQKILDSFAEPFLIEGQKYFITSSIGVTMFKDATNTVEELLKHADLAMYQAKAIGRNTMRFFETEMQTAITARSKAEQQLREALDKKQFTVHYQAQFNSANQIIGAEALLRWVNDDNDVIYPGTFIPLAEESGLIIPIGEWVLQAACTQLAVWQNNPRFKHLELAVNVSVKQFMRYDFVERVLAILEETGANPRLLTLEITESLFMQDVTQIIAKIALLKAKGVAFALDDFGVGYSSLTHLRHLPLDQLKIDQSFVQGITSHPIDLAIAKSVIEMAKNLKIAVIAEGVETEAQRRLLEVHGCYKFQGYLFSQPLPLMQFEALLLKS